VYKCILTINEERRVAPALGVMAAGGAVLHVGHQVHHLQQCLVDEHILRLGEGEGQGSGWVWIVGAVMNTIIMVVMVIVILVHTKEYSSYPLESELFSPKTSLELKSTRIDLHIS